MEDFIVKLNIEILAPTKEVWEALITPETVKKYFFGTTIETSWKVGSPIYWKGSWEGKSYEDKGSILEFTPEKRLIFTYWSSFSGLPDQPENYKKIIYELKDQGNRTLLSLTQSNNSDEETAKHSEKNWMMVFDGLKKLLEERK